MLCLNCGEKEAVKKFCSSGCSASFNNRISPKRVKSEVVTTCSGCKADFVQPSWRKCKYCSDACYKSSVTLEKKSRVRKSIARYTDSERASVLSDCAIQQGVDAYSAYIERWKEGLESGMKGSTSLSRHIRRYLFDKFGSKCSRCGWCEVHPTTNNVPLEVEHLDGDFRNNQEGNLDLLCPNCHSLTPTYRALNRGRGRPRK
jgi:hypothetical protein